MMKLFKRLTSLLLLCSLILQSFGILEVKAANDEFHITSESDLINLVSMSQGYTFDGTTIYLDNDITIASEYSGNDSLSFNKNSEVPFKGTFEGNGHTIYNLNHHSTINYETCTGLFGYTDGATIRNFTISDAYIGADSLGGAVIGRALNTLIENVTVANSTISVKCADNVITLITDGGLVGGGLVGVLESSVMYNCEANNIYVVNNATEAVAAISGKGLYLGGLVGDSKNSTIEYSRVINGSRVNNYYDVAVGAVGGNTLYVGGIVGEMRNGSQVIDSYSTADLHFYCATYVSVGGGNSGHIGGIAGAAYGSSDSVIRSHFAGTASSTQYNAVLVIPIVQNNVNLFGLIDKNDGEYIENSYYMANNSKFNGALGDGSVTDNSGALSDATYASREFFEDNGYDVVGNIVRNTAYSSSHINKWVMYHDPANNKTYPIHGLSFMAGFDYPNSGSVTIHENSHNSLYETTNDATKFALQIATPSDTQTVVVALNSGYRLYGWYKSSANSTAVSGHEYYDSIFASNSVISSDTAYTFSGAMDKDLYLARMQANVVFHDYEGNVIDRSGANDSITSDNYYFYKETLPNFEPTNRPSDTNERFIGWTTVEGTHTSITSNELEGYKASGEFYTYGEEVIKPLNLYPVYASFISNIHLVYEGNELDSIDDVTQREGYGYLTATIDENNIATISLNKTYSDLSHYRFLGWYENGHRVSRDESYVLEDVDLTFEHTYEARFEYLVDYYVKDEYTNSGSYSYKNGDLYQSVWHTYSQELKQISAPNFISSDFDGWVLDGYQGTQSAEGYLVTKADDKAYSKVSDARESSYTISITTDFPNSAVITESKSLARITLTIQENPYYHLQFWTRDDWGALSRIDHTLGKDNPYAHNYGTGYSYQFRARMLADATFHQYDGSSTNVLRGFKENILQDGSGVREYHYLMDDKVINNSDITALGGEVNITASPNALNRDGYYFVGWVDKDAMSNDELSYVFDIDEYTSSSLDKAKPYVLNANDLVERAMPNIYAVYVPYNVVTTTNIKEVGVKAPQNLPSNPSYTGLDNTEEASLLSFTVLDGVEYVVGNTGETYRLTKFTVSVNGGNELEIVNPYEYTVKAGNEYIFKAYYEPLVVNFHINSVDSITWIRNNGETINNGSDEMPLPEFSINNEIESGTGRKYIFVGYTEKESNTFYHRLNDQSELSDYVIVNGGSVVSHSMDLYSVYAPVSVNVNSNIDTVLANSGIDVNSVRYMTNIDLYNIGFMASDNNIGYTFMGWYSGYVDDNNMGTLVSDAASFVLDGEDAFKNITYTAVYKPTVTINYHSYEDNRPIIYSNNVIVNSRAFVEHTSYEYIDSEGNTQTFEGDAYVDGEAFEVILASLSDNQKFIEWVYEDNEGNIHRWSEFSNELISSNMDLYPMILEYEAFETPLNKEGTVVNKEVTNLLDIALNEKDDTYECIASINEEYYRVQANIDNINKYELIPNFTISIHESFYIPEKINDGLKDINVSLYKSHDGTLYDTKTTNINGEASFSLYGELVVSVNAEEGDDFIFTVERGDGDNYVPYARFSLRNGDSQSVNLPYGEYRVIEDNTYAWRYLDVNEVDGLIISNLRDASANFTNEITNNKWFDYNERRVNEYD